MLWNVQKQTLDPNRLCLTQLIWMEATFTLDFFKRHFMSLEVEVKKHLQKNPASISFQTCIIISPVCCPPQNLLFFCNSYFLTRMKELYCPLRPARFKRSDEVGKEMYTSKFRFGEAVLWSKDASISVEVHLCNVLNSELMNGADFFF